MSAKINLEVYISSKKELIFNLFIRTGQLFFLLPFQPTPQNLFSLSPFWISLKRVLVRILSQQHLLGIIFSRMCYQSQCAYAIKSKYFAAFDEETQCLGRSLIGIWNWFYRQSVYHWWRLVNLKLKMDLFNNYGLAYQIF